MTLSAYRPDIDGLRAVAILSVLIYHCNSELLQGGFVGVDIFFVISGFVVTSSLIKNKADSLSKYISEFYARRLARILPALTFVLIISALASTLFIPPAWLSEFIDTTVKYAFFGLSNWSLQQNSDNYFSPRSEFNPYTHTWSLGIEEQFYLLAPFIIYFCSNSLKRQPYKLNTALILLIFIAISSVGLCIYTAFTSRSNIAFYFIGCRFWELASGALLFLLTYQKKQHLTSNTKHSRLKEIMPWVGVFILVLSLCLADESYFPLPWAIAPVLGTIFIIESAHPAYSGIIKRCLSSKIALWIGKRSYSLYLWHWPIFVLMRWTIGLHDLYLYGIAFLIVFLLSEISYSIIEKPLRHSYWIEKQTRLIRITGFICLPIFGFYTTNYFFQHRYRFGLSTVVQNSTDWYSRERMPYSVFGNRQCTVTIQRHILGDGKERRYVPTGCREKTGISKRIYVLGDSHAESLSPIFEQISSDLNVIVSLYIFKSGGCSFIDLKAPMGKNLPNGCLEFNHAVTEDVLRTSAMNDIVLLPSLRLDRYTDSWSNFSISSMYNEMYNSERLKLRKLAFKDAESWLQGFKDKQLKIIFLAPTPILKVPAFRCSDWFNRANPICVDSDKQSIMELEYIRGPVIKDMKLLSTNGDVVILDFFNILCPDKFCNMHKDGRPLFFDGDHLSAYGNSLIYPEFKKFVISIASH